MEDVRRLAGRPRAFGDAIAVFAHRRARRCISAGVREGGGRIPRASDPVKLGLVASLNRPGGNASGFWLYTSLLGTKRFEMMRQLFPASTLIAILVNPNNPNAQIDMPDLQDAARTV